MKGSHVVALFVAAAITVLVVWIARNSYWEEVSVPMPMQGEARTNPMYAAQRLAEKLGVQVESLRQLDALPDTNSVIYLSYWNWNLVHERREQLQAWVESGGRLVADRSLIGGESELESWTGIKPQVLPLDENQQISVPDDNCADLDVESVIVNAAASSDSYYVCGTYSHSRLTHNNRHRASWVLSDEQGMQALRVNIGRGSFTMINGTPFDNYLLFDGDNALVFVAATGIDRGARMLFLSEKEAASLLELIWEHGAPVVLLALAIVALALWRGSLRFGPPAGVVDPARRSLAEQIVGTGRFTLRFGGGRALHAATVRALHETAQRYISGYGSMHHEARIAAIATHTGMDESSLAEAINYAGSRRASELRKVVALLESARRRIT